MTAAEDRRIGFGVPSAMRPDHARHFSERESIAKGDRSTDACRTEEALNLVRGRPDFRLLIMELEMPDDPLARAE